jgi:Raf kinase inhibitor-like YbhB/YbcL family protein
MKLWSNSWANGDRIAERYAAGRLEAAGGVGFAENCNPHLAWTELPPGTRSLVLICHDFDVPSRGDDVNQPDREIPSDLPRVDFFHWVLVDLPPTLGQIAEGEYSRAFTPRGKAGPQAAHGARQGLNDYTGWFAADKDMSGNYFGYDGPCPPWNDEIPHHYVFTVFALDVAKLAVDGAFTGAQAREAMKGRVLAQASITGRYTLNPGVRL